MNKKVLSEGNNICKFIHASNRMSFEITPINFVWERSDVREKEQIYSVYSFYIVMKGEGTLVIGGKSYDVSRGDVFITQPSSCYAIKSKQDLEYAYISFLGPGAPMLIKRLDNAGEPVYRGWEELIEFWTNAINMANAENVDFIARGVLFYSAARLIRIETDEVDPETIADIEKYVKQNFTDPKLSLQALSERFGYNVKYLSKFFLQHTGVKYSDYITNLRITAACALLSEGKVPIKEVAYRCGFRDALYFSRVFKEKMLLSPLEFQKSRPE